MNKSKIIFFVLFFLAFLFLFFEFVFPQPTQNNFLYIFDASGSMERMMEDRTKFDIAKEVLIDSINKLPHNVGVGLLYFGNNIKGKDCIRFPIPVETKNREKIIEEIKRLQPGGLTPLAQSLMTAAEVLDKEGKNATFILITDGKEECGGKILLKPSRIWQKGESV